MPAPNDPADPPSDLQHRDLPITDLHLDLENPRTGEAADEQEATDLLWEEAEKSICGLGRHISENGLNNADPLYVIPRPAGGYTVIEGNRRLLALRSLADPPRISARAQEARQAFAALVRRDPGVQAPSTAACYIYPSRQAAEMWIDIKHMGPGGGEGTYRWDPKAKYNRSVKRGDPRKYGPEMWRWLRRVYKSDKEMHDLVLKAEETQYTYMTRIATKKAFRETLRVSMGANGIECGYKAIEVRAPMRRMLTDIANKRIDARSLRDTEQIKDYILNTLNPLIQCQDELFPSAPGPRPPSNSDKGGTGRTANRSDGTGVKSADRPAGSSSKETIDQERDISTTPHPQDRRDESPHPVETNPMPKPSEDHIFPTVNFTPFGPRIAAIGEQAQKLSIRRHRDICGVMLRVLIDLTTTQLIAKYDQKKPSYFADQVQAAIEILDPKIKNLKKQKNSALAILYWEFTTKAENHGFAAPRLHDMVHSPTRVTTESEIRQESARYEPLLTAMSNLLAQGSTRVSTGQENGQS
ncbi:ParB/Srx family N-terminal domain-containing protein [Actinomyces gaoshouyii]|uniref:ParB/Srx family N-terminal domain-containing protein n=1 Tax=Actinomyces gaoshouyii TaxID=1960083 RepID=UPI0009C13B75|nr:ParB/Srx family N-terminal domain-containing protein [Actinomyces gaoshouyii]ARD41306.1 hypothetical protein B6G06_02035 [Actinomyces gaoshouyii]